MCRITPHIREWPVSSDLTPFINRVVYSVCEQPGEIKIPSTGSIFLSYVPGSPLTVHFNDHIYRRKPRFFLGGQLRDERPILRSDGRFELIGLQFTPTGYYRLLHHDARPLTDSIADLADMHPELVLALDRQLHSRTAAPQDIITGIESVLRQHIEIALEAPIVDSIVKEIVLRNGVVRIGELYKQYPLTDRHLRRYFEEVVGLPAKYFAKICQVNAVIRAMIRDDRETLRALAMDHGFYDQSHFIRDFQALVGMDPSGFLRHGSRLLHPYLGNTSRESKSTEADRH